MQLQRFELGAIRRWARVEDNRGARKASHVASGIVWVKSPCNHRQRSSQ